MDKVKMACYIVISTILLIAALDLAERSFDRYCDLKLYERGSKIESKNVVPNRSSPLVEIIQTGVKPGDIVEEEL